MGMFGLDDDYWGEHDRLMRERNKNLIKGNVGEHPDRWGGCPQEMMPGFYPVMKLSTYDLDGWVIPDTLGGGIIAPWSTIENAHTSQSYARHVALDSGELLPHKRVVAVELDTEVDVAGYIIYWPDKPGNSFFPGIIVTNNPDLSTHSSNNVQVVMNSLKQGSIDIVAAAGMLKSLADWQLVKTIKEVGF